jgi:hypothetical protein
MTGPTKRLNAGNGHRYLLDGDKVPGVTTILGDGLPKPALIAWAANTIAGNVIEHITFKDGHADADELINHLRTIGTGEGGNRRNRWPNDGAFSRLAALETLSGLHYRDRDQAANKGTKVHDFAEQLAAGHEIEPPEYLIGHVDAYMHWWEEWQPANMMTEVVVASRRHRYMGTLDIIAEIDGQRWLIDIKTNRSGPFKEVALQLAAYGHADFMIIDGTEQRMPVIDRYGVLWLRADGYDFYPINVTAATFRTFLYVQQVAQFQQSEPSEHIGESLHRNEVAA